MIYLKRNAEKCYWEKWLEMNLSERDVTAQCLAHKSVTSLLQISAINRAATKCAAWERSTVFKAGRNQA